VRLLRERSDDVEADLQRYYRVDLRGLFSGSLTLRRVGVLVRHLPAESACVSALAEHVDPRAADESPQRLWGTSEHLLAGVLDAVREVAWLVAQTNSSKRIPAPKPIPRPGPKPKPRRLTAQQRARLDKWNREGMVG
jgi:hypothetical protein